MCVTVLPAFKFIVCDGYNGQEKVLAIKELQLPMVVSHHVGAGN